MTFPFKIPLLWKEVLIFNQTKKMNSTLKGNIERIRIDMINRIDQLHKNIKEYKRDEDFEHAMKCDIKMKQLTMVLERLDEALK